MLKKIFLLLTASVIFHACLAENGYHISIHLNGLADTNVILGHYLDKSLYPDDTVRVNSQGKGTFKGDKKLNEGMYIIFPPLGGYFDVIIGADQEFSISSDTSDYVRNFSSSGSLENELFYDFQHYMLSKKDDMVQLQEDFKNAKTDKEKDKLKEKMRAMNDERIEKVKTIRTENPDLFVGQFLSATLEVEVPEAPRDEEGNLIDSNWSYSYYRTHYFDNFDYSDPRMLRTPFFNEKLFKYVDKIIPQIPDSINAELDVIIRNVEHDSVLFSHTLTALFNHYVESKIMGMESVWVYIADNYYLERIWWSKEEYLKELQERVNALKPILLGNIAPDVQLRYVPDDHFKAAQNDTALKRYPHAGEFFNISQIKSDYTVLVFWDPTCGHCKKDIPKFHKIFSDTLKPQGIKVIAISTLFGEDGKEQWVDFVNKNELYGWINCWNPYDYKYKQIYDIRTNPQFFILDHKKEIIAKRIGSEQVTDVIATHKKYKNKN